MRIDAPLPSQRLGGRYNNILSDVGTDNLTTFEAATARLGALAATEPPASTAATPESSAGTIVNPVYNPPADTGSAGPVAAGTVTPYGTALWIPTGYPVATQPFLTADQRIILRPIRVPPATDPSSLNVYAAYIMTALQAAVNQLAPTPYGVDWVTSQSEGIAIVKAMLVPPLDHFGLITRTTSAAGIDPNWMLLPPTPTNTIADQVFNIGKAATMGEFVSGVNAIVPGLGTQLTNYVNSAAAGTLTGKYSDSDVTSTGNVVNSILSGTQGGTAADTDQQVASDVDNSGTSNITYILIAIAVIVILYLWLS